MFTAFAQQKKYKVHTIAFYNTENLYDATDDPAVNDAEFLPDGAESWTEEKYETKLANIAKVISEIGVGDNPDMPTIVGLAEIENSGVLEDLVQEQSIAGRGYCIVHFESPDYRGIDVALLYQKKHFKPTSYKKVPLIIAANKEAGNEKDTDDDKPKADVQTKRIFTRDVLLVTGMLDNEEIHFIVNHWPSRSGGEKKSKPYREAAAALNRKIIDSLFEINPIAKIITMGDFNDGPFDSSLKSILQATGRKENVKKEGLYNPMGAFLEDGIGTVAYKDAWDVFDQLIVSWPLIEKDYHSLRLWRANVFNKPYLTQQSGKYKGYPLRNSNGEVGYSDHFPVYLYLIKEM
jgi:hypothetical protein